MVIDAAAELADAKGWHELTLANLAEVLRVRSPSLFNHVGGLADLRRELKLRALRELGAVMGKAAIGKSRNRAVSALAHAYREFATGHPGLYLATIEASDAKDADLDVASDAVLEVCAAVLSGYELGRRDLIHAIRAMRSLVHGFASIEASHGFGIPIDIDQSFDWAVDRFIEGLEGCAASIGGQRFRRRASVGSQT